MLGNNLQVLLGELFPPPTLHPGLWHRRLWNALKSACFLPLQPRAGGLHHGFRSRDFLPLFSSLSRPLPCGSFERRLSPSELLSRPEGLLRPPRDTAEERRCGKTGLNRLLRLIFHLERVCLAGGSPRRYPSACRRSRVSLHAGLQALTFRMTGRGLLGG